MLKEVFRRRHLPHWDVPHAAYFVTTCLAGSIPAQGFLDIEGYRAELKRRAKPPDMHSDDWQAHLWKLHHPSTTPPADRCRCFNKAAPRSGN